MPRTKQEAKKRKKWRTRVLKDSPFPIPIKETMAEPMPDGAWFYYTGYLEGSTVVVKHTGDMDFLYKMGFFGKGTLSRSEPNFHERNQRVNLRCKNEKDQTQPPCLVKAAVTSKRKYLTHKRYKALLEENGTEYNYIIHCEEQQKLGLEGLSDEEDDNKDEEEEEDEDEINFDDGIRRLGPSSMKSYMMEAHQMLSGNSGQSVPNAKPSDSSTSSTQMLFSRASKETQSAVVALLSEVAALSNEKIATFAEVPHTLAELRDKYERLRQEEMALVHRRQFRNLLSYAASGAFGQGEVIELDDVEDAGGGRAGDSVVVLDSDDEDGKDGDDLNKEKGGVQAEGKGAEWRKSSRDGSKGWGDYDKADLDSWGLPESHGRGADTVAESKAEGSTRGEKDGFISEESSSATKSCEEDIQEKSSLNGDKNLKEKNSSGVNGDSKELKARNVHDDLKETAKVDENSAKIERGIKETKTSEVYDSKEKATEREEIIAKDAGSCGEEVSETEAGKLLQQSELQNGEAVLDNITGDAEVMKGNGDIGNKGKFNESTESLSNSVVEISGDDSKLSVDPESLRDSMKDENNGDRKSKSGGGSAEKGELEKSSSTRLAYGKDESDDDDDDDDDVASNDSDDVICIESESATPSRVHNFLSQGSDSRKVTVTKSVTFMSNISSQATYVTAKVGYSSWDSLIHFNYIGDPTHLPTVMAAESSPSESSSNITRSSHKNGSEASQQVYERLFPPVSTLLPGSMSQGAIIKQRTKALPCLSSAILKLSMLGMPTSRSQSLVHQKHWQQQQQQTTRSTFGPTTSQSSWHSHTSSTSKQSPISVQTTPVVVSNSYSIDSESQANAHSPILPEKGSGSANVPPKNVSTASQFQPAVILNYLKGFCEQEDSSVENGSLDSSHSNVKAQANDDTVPSLFPLLNSVQKLRDLYKEWKAISSASSLPKFVDRDNLLSQFHKHLHQYLPSAGVSPQEESNLLTVLLLSKTDSAALLSDKEVLETMNNLTPFQMWLLEERLKYVTGVNNGGESFSQSYQPAEAGSVGRKRRNSEVDDSECSENKKHKLSGGQGREGSVFNNEKPVGSSTSSQMSGVENGVKKPTVDGAAILKPDLHTNSEDISTEIDNTDKKESNGGSEILRLKSTGDNTVGKTQNDTDEKSVSGSVPENNNIQVAGKSSDSALAKKSTDLEATGAKSVKDDIVDQICIGSSSSSSEGEDDFDDVDNSDNSVEMSSEPTLDARSLCRTDDPDGDLFVVNNTSEEEELEEEHEEEVEAVRNAHRWRPCLKSDPCPVEERLHLMLEEAFFLTFGLGCLRILDLESKALDLTEMWCQFQVLKEQFVPHYVAYHYFRSKGWVPKSGLKFGCDFILYKEGPPFYHGSYSVVVQCVREGSLLPCTRREGYRLDHRHLNWISLAGLNRITEHVAKELMFCYVVWPRGLTQEDLQSPDCISRFKVKEVLVSRWVSSQERENKTEEEMP
ncbi:tRNA-splicing endonuclease subunit sen2-like [Plakobranchus ocellatus]|uniref:tRNA-intron lyase n=1 Tax=Plakobranchus ocellatus TaxID=259542 RepID=A0AAV4C865_9GAST|nr:tRNA-splicing endonuclease subunit sen2-like [Plakobranchus ocellatus]